MIVQSLTKSGNLGWGVPSSPGQSGRESSRMDPLVNHVSDQIPVGTWLSRYHSH